MNEPIHRPDWEDLPDGRLSRGGKQKKARHRLRRAPKPEPVTSDEQVAKAQHRFIRNERFGQRVTTIVFTFLLAYVIALVIFDDAEAWTRVTRAMAAVLLFIAWYLHLGCRREFRKARRQQVEAMTMMHVLSEMTSGFTWGESVVVVCYSRDDIDKVAREIMQHDKVKGVYPAGVPNWVEGKE